MPWLRMALKAKRYESYCFPHFNLGRVFESLGKLNLALDHYRKALEENLGYGAAIQAIERVQTKLGAQEPTSSGGGQ